MAKMMIVGDTLVNELEYQNKEDQFKELLLSAESEEESAHLTLEVSNGLIEASTVKNELAPPDPITGKEVPYEPIGIGKPLSIEILTVYTGDFRKNIAFGKRRDLLLSTAIKSSATYQAQAKALNMLKSKSEERSYLNFSAMDEGTRIVFYSPAVEVDSYEVSFNFIADSFDQELINTISQAFSAAAAFPVFLPASTFLLAGSEVLNIAGKLGNSLLQKAPFLNDSLRIQFGLGGLVNSVPRKTLIYNSDDAQEFEGFEAKAVDVLQKVEYKLVHKETKLPYSGPAPYLIINIDGAKREGLESFSPKLATASILQQFGEGNKSSVATAALEDAMKLYNDLNYNKKANNKRKQLAQLTVGSEQYNKENALYDAYIANIQSEEFKPKATPEVEPA
ncbi:hypothetical protein ACFSJU_13815 [Paradesertivirga mongoliensis]|uniref:Uncharacterized protein n=1 Tax=Paradesertivirga mongoliensis TaxID=2100740 RepID=A0ABW4ZP39_9SPHI|nr:hypothetical protein [Pedobacter mongoliensis]